MLAAAAGVGAPPGRPGGAGGARFGIEGGAGRPPVLAGAGGGCRLEPARRTPGLDGVVAFLKSKIC